MCVVARVKNIIPVEEGKPERWRASPLEMEIFIVSCKDVAGKALAAARCSGINARTELFRVVDGSTHQIRPKIASAT